MTQETEKLEETFFRDPNWIANNGGWLHSNNVLFYFGASPFCEGMSKNTSIFVQSAGIPELIDRNLASKQIFESRLKERPGIEYVVVHDPLESNTKIQGPEGLEQSRTWVIRKQNREKGSSDDRVTPLAYYFIANDAIFQAPSTGDVLTNRLLSTITSLSNMLAATSDLAVFSPSRGHSYFPPVRKEANPNHGVLSQRSKEPSPLPGLQSTATAEAQSQPVNDTQTIVDAIRMTLRYEKEYMDEAPLVGEPGNFRLATKQKDALAVPAPSASKVTQVAASSRDHTPSPIHAPSPPPPIRTDVPPVTSKKSAKSGDRSASMSAGLTKPKRRKSKIGSAEDLQMELNT